MDNAVLQQLTRRELFGRAFDGCIVHHPLVIPLARLDAIAFRHGGRFVYRPQRVPCRSVGQCGHESVLGQAAIARNVAEYGKCSMAHGLQHRFRHTVGVWNRNDEIGCAPDIRHR